MFSSLGSIGTAEVNERFCHQNTEPPNCCLMRTQQVSIPTAQRACAVGFDNRDLDGAGLQAWAHVHRENMHHPEIFRVVVINVHGYKSLGSLL